MIGWRFQQLIPEGEGGDPFEKLFKIFQQLLTMASGNVAEALSWLTQLDKKYKLTTDAYGVADFIQDLIDKGYIQESDADKSKNFEPTAKMEITMRKQALEEIFGQLKKSKPGKHSTKFAGRGDELTADVKPYEFGDSLEHIAVTNSLRNAYVNHGIEDFKMTNEDLEMHETYLQSQMSTVLMIDISHSMILYGEDRITPAKKSSYGTFGTHYDQISEGHA